MDPIQAIVLALVQGLTEFLPISSSAHLILVPALLGWPDQGLAFDVAVHVGSLAAVVAYLRRDLRELAGGWLRSVFRARPFAPESRRGWMVIAATVPVGAAGLLAGEAVELHLRTPAVIAGANLVFALALLAADRWGSGTRGAESLGIRGAVLIGCAQALALVPRGVAVRGHDHGGPRPRPSPRGRRPASPSCSRSPSSRSRAERKDTSCSPRRERWTGPGSGSARWWRG